LPHGAGFVNKSARATAFTRCYGGYTGASPPARGRNYWGVLAGPIPRRPRLPLRGFDQVFGLTPPCGVFNSLAWALPPPPYHFFHRAGNYPMGVSSTIPVGAVAMGFPGWGVAEDLPLSRQVFWSFASQNSPTVMARLERRGGGRRGCRPDLSYGNRPPLFTLPSPHFSLLTTNY
jgi:hypothetical protein